MRRLTLILLCFSLAAGAFAQGPPEGKGQGNGVGRGHSDDHDDNSPIDTGYAVITPSSASSSLVVFETFGMKTGEETNQAGILPSGLTTSALMFINSSGRLSRNVGVAIVNPSNSNANVTMTLRDEDGSVLATSIVAVAARQQTAKLVTEMFSTPSAIPSDVTGTLSLTSATPIAVVGLRFRGNNFSTLPVTSLSGSSAVPVIATGVGGPGAVLLSQFAANGGWSTEIVIANTGASSATVRVDLFKSDGTALTARLNGESGSSFTNISIPAHGVVTLAPRDSNGDSRF